MNKTSRILNPGDKMLIAVTYDDEDGEQRDAEIFLSDFLSYPDAYEVELLGVEPCSKSQPKRTAP